MNGIRFAPSPTGRFHIGNLRTAWIAKQFALTLQEPFVVRFEDIDAPRVRPESQREQTEDLLSLGLKPDLVVVQSSFRARHFELFKLAITEGLVYPCDCSRADVQAALAGAASAPHVAAAIYSGHCRALKSPREFHAPDSLAWRFRSENPGGSEDFIVARTAVALDARGWPSFESFVPAYHWPCAIDDADGAYSLIVRAADLHSALAPQRAIQKWMGGGPPAAFHTSLVTQDDGHRLEKRTKGVTLEELAARGISSKDLIAKFEASFDRRLLRALLPAADAGEARVQISLHELSL